jgi:hypothetical protein
VTTSGARSTAFLAAIIALNVAGAATVGMFIWIRGAYGVWLPSQTPERIPLCGQTYTKRDDRLFTLDQAVRGDPDPSPIVLEPTILRLPIGNPTPSRFEPGAGYNGCGHMVLLRVADDGYLLYFKLGGP